MSEPMTPEILDELVDTDPLRLKEIALSLLIETKQLRAALERLIPEAHDLDSTKCRDRAAQQEALSPFQQSTAEYDDDCPACDVQAALSSSPTEEKG